jgi:regulator of chromosome condensation
VRIQKRPLLIPGLKMVTQISVGADFALALDATGRVFAWGCGQQCELGHRLIERRRALALLPNPLRLSRSAKIVSIHAAMNHAFAVDAKGDTWAWGSNNFAQMGSGLSADEEDGTVAVVQRVRSLVGKKMKMIEGGSHHSVGVTRSGECLVWGRIDGGQLGLDVSKLPLDDPNKVIVDSRNKPRILLQPTPLPISNCAHAASGSDHSLLVVSEGKVYSWGFNATYQCGQGTDDDILVAKQMNGKQVRDQKITWAGGGGQYSMFASRLQGE